ncbi:hypothetical protein L1987_55890 [Smallanthus sonchifolius]|uniref:Uncharacterized protein n=1 Tax=Smallanthus sonchifolius TaxID=185202 RepID=A0ACB9EB80_9ASTR|nr:hypothetical protein L1987_55890 [Smallanthus sonchifolius]
MGTRGSDDAQVSSSVQAIHIKLLRSLKIRHRNMSSTPPPSPKAPGHDAPILSSPEPKRRQTCSSDYSVDQGEPSSVQATNPALNWNAYPQMIQRWIEMGNVSSPYFGSASSSSTLPRLPCTMEQAFVAFENKVGIELLTAELAVTDQVHNVLVDRVTRLETRVDTSDFEVGGILERVANLEGQLQAANHAAEGLQERVTHLETQLQAALFPEDISLSDGEEEPFEEEPFDDEPLEEEPSEEEPVEIDDAQSYVSFDDEDV